jgi:uncharacterized protein YfcZ (UPF0381/DUF406 family)
VHRDEVGEVGVILDNQDCTVVCHLQLRLQYT